MKKIRRWLYYVRAGLPDWLHRGLAVLVQTAHQFKAEKFDVVFVSGVARTDRADTCAVAVGCTPTIEYLLDTFFETIHARKASHFVKRRGLKSIGDDFKNIDLGLAGLPKELNVATRGMHWRVPEAVRLTINLSQETSREMLVRYRKRVTKQIEQWRLDHSISTAQRDFEWFYDCCYLPYVKARFGLLARPHSRVHLARAFRRGGIVWVTKDGIRLAGILFSIYSEAALHLVVSAVTPERSDSREIGALRAARTICIDLAFDHGCSTVDLGIARPNLNDGVLRHKLQWGATIGDTADRPYDVLLFWQRPRQIHLDWLAKTPLVVRDGQNLAALTSLGQWESIKESRKRLRQLVVPGLKRIIVLAKTDEQRDVDAFSGLPVCIVCHQDNRPPASI